MQKTLKKEANCTVYTRLVNPSHGNMYNVGLITLISSHAEAPKIYTNVAAGIAT